MSHANNNVVSYFTATNILIDRCTAEECADILNESYRASKRRDATNNIISFR